MPNATYFGSPAKGISASGRSTVTTASVASAVAAAGQNFPHSPELSGGTSRLTLLTYE
jgi:hypothetical protein